MTVEVKRDRREVPKFVSAQGYKHSAPEYQEFIGGNSKFLTMRLNILVGLPNRKLYSLQLWRNHGSSFSCSAASLERCLEIYVIYAIIEVCF
jgi:hypothetical protein